MNVITYHRYNKPFLPFGLCYLMETHVLDCWSGDQDSTIQSLLAAAAWCVGCGLYGSEHHQVQNWTGIIAMSIVLRIQYAHSFAGALLSLHYQHPMIHINHAFTYVRCASVAPGQQSSWMWFQDAMKLTWGFLMGMENCRYHNRCSRALWRLMWIP